MDTNKLVKLLGPWSVGKGPLYTQLAVGLQKAILQGDVPAGTRLPAERPLAQALAVSRTTVVAAYDLLREDDLAESRPGSGTWVKTVSGARSWRRQDAQARSLTRNPLFDTLLGGPEAMIDFSKASSGNPEGLDPGVFALPPDELSRLLTEHGYSPLGLPALRRVIADDYTRMGLPTTPDQVLVT